jgi:HPt (histidine-containing phosphotransfer) domain-containing protein
MYITNTETSIKNIEDGVENRDAHAISQNAHTIKSPSTQMGAKKIAGAASELEKAAKEGNFAFCGELLTSLKSYFIEAREELKKLSN